MEELTQLRKKIDAVDEQILRCLSERVRVCEAVGAEKKAHGLPVHDKEREKEVFSCVRARALELGLSPLQVEVVYREIVNMCSSVQE